MCWYGQKRVACIKISRRCVLAGDSSSRVLKLLPVRRPVSGADVEASVDVVHNIFKTTKERNQGMTGNEKGLTQGMNWSVEHAQTKITPEYDS